MEDLFINVLDVLGDLMAPWLYSFQVGSTRCSLMFRKKKKQASNRPHNLTV